MATPITGNRQLIRRLEDAVANNPDSAMTYTKLGTAYYKAGLLKKSEAALNKAIELDNKCMAALVNLGGVLLSRWDFKGCVEVNEKAIKVDPNSLKAHYNAGLGYLYLAKPEKMLDCFTRVTQIDKNHSAGHYYMSVALMAQKKEIEARRELAIAMKLGYKPEPEFMKAFKPPKGSLPVIEVEPKTTTK